MPTYTEHVSLIKPNSTEKYDISVVNMNMDLIDSALNKIDKKDENQDDLLATKESLNLHINSKENPHEVTKTHVGLSDVENKSSEVIMSEITKENIANALGYTPYSPNEIDNKFSTLETKLGNDSGIVYSDEEPDVVANDMTWISDE